MSTFEERRQIEQRMETRATLRKLCGEIAANLGDGWTLLEDRRNDETYFNHYFNIAHFDGRSFSISGENYGETFDGKLSISGNYQYSSDLGVSSLPYGVERPSIGVAAKRGAQAIAKDIERRFLPDLTNMQTKQQERFYDYAVARAHRGAMMLRLGELAGCDFQLSTRPDGGFLRENYNGFHVYRPGTVTPEVKSSSGSVTITVDCSEVLAMRIIALVNLYNIDKGQEGHPHVGVGLCKVCGHYGDDCTGTA